MLTLIYGNNSKTNLAWIGINSYTQNNCFCILALKYDLVVTGQEINACALSVGVLEFKSLVIEI